LLNNKLDSWSAKSFRAAEVEYSLLGNWIGQRFIPARESSDGRPSFSFPSDVVVDLPLGVLMRITSGLPLKQPRKKPPLQFTHRVIFEFGNPLSLEAVLTDYTAVFQHLLCLLTGQNIFHDETAFYEVNSSEEKAYRRQRRPICSNAVTE